MYYIHLYYIQKYKNLPIYYREIYYLSFFNNKLFFISILLKIEFKIIVIYINAIDNIDANSIDIFDISINSTLYSKANDDTSIDIVNPIPASIDT